MSGNDSNNPNDQKPAVPANGGDLLVSDAERDLALGRLREGYVEGRITLDEYSERLDSVLDARTEVDLQAATRGLPAVPGSAPASHPSGPTQPAPPWTVSIMSDTKRQGRWMLGEPINALSLMASLQLDLRQAELSRGELVVNLYVVMGSVKLFVPAGVEVLFEEITLMGSRHDRRTAPEPPPGAALVRLRGLVLMGSLEILNEEQSFFTRIAERFGTRLAPPVAPGELAPPGRQLTPHEELIARHIERRLERWERRLERRERRGR